MTEAAAPAAGRPVVHYADPRPHAACRLPRPPIPEGQLTEDRSAVTCKRCRATRAYSGEGSADG